MNPGLISCFALQGIEDVAKLVLKNKEDNILAEFVKKQDYARMAQHLDLHTIHVSEIDT